MRPWLAFPWGAELDPGALLILAELQSPYNWPSFYKNKTDISLGGKTMGNHLITFKDPS